MESSPRNTSEKVEEANYNLLEESCFFGNLLNTKTRTMSRCSSDLASNQEILIKKSSNDRKSSSFSSRNKHPIAPSSLMPRSMETRVSKKANQSSNLIRAPSLPTFVVESDHEEDEEDQESEFTMGRLIRQASLNASHTSTLPRQIPKVMTESSSLPRYPRKKPETYQEKIISNMGKLEMISKVKKKGGAAPVVPGPPWAVDHISSEDIKAQIKFWARAVASNVRQEC